jgi:hypothetical protein
MKKTSILIFLSLAIAGCNNSATTQQNTTNTTTVTQSNTSNSKSDDSLTVSSHSQKSTSQTPTSSGNSSAGGASPMQRGVDVSEMTADIEKAEKEFKAKPTDEKAKSDLAEAYFKRAFVLTDAAQYRAALGDFRKGLKLKPDAKEAKDMHDQIIDIFKSIGREPPKEGEEPAPMPINK